MANLIQVFRSFFLQNGREPVVDRIRIRYLQAIVKSQSLESFADVLGIARRS
jgi:hypothetical protein